MALCAVGFFAGCEEIEEEKPWIQVERPQMLFTDTTLLDSYNNDVLSWKLKTAYLERWADKEIVFVRPIFVDIYDSLGERAAFLRADSGRFDMKFTYVNAYGHVYALTPKGASVRADSLIWNKRDNLVRTESYVRVVSEDGDVLQGKGFESDAKMDHWKILADVTGIFQDAANRLREEDKKQAEEHAMPDSAASAAPAASATASAATTASAQFPAASGASSAASTSNPQKNSAPSNLPSNAPAQSPTASAHSPAASAQSPAASAQSPAASTTASAASTNSPAPSAKTAASAVSKSEASDDTLRREMDPAADAELLRQSRQSLQKHMRPGKAQADSVQAGGSRADGFRADSSRADRSRADSSRADRSRSDSAHAGKAAEGSKK